MTCRIGALGIALTLLWGCGSGTASRFGEPVDPAAAVPLAKLLAAGGGERPEMVTVSGRIGEVCSSAGCWFVLVDTSGGNPVELFVDLKGGASFTVPTRIRGRDAVVRGRLVGREPDLTLRALGLVLK